MLINQEFDSESEKPYKVSTQWMSPEWNAVTTVGTSRYSFTDAIGNMIVEMASIDGSPVVLTLTDHEGVVTLQPKM